MVLLARNTGINYIETQAASFREIDIGQDINCSSFSCSRILYWCGNNRTIVCWTQKVEATHLSSLLLHNQHDSFLYVTTKILY